MPTIRRSIPDFALANPIYVGALVSFWTVDPLTGLKTSTLATLYSSPTAATTATNPQTLDGEGKFTAPVYTDVPVIAEVVGPNVESHVTGPIQMRGTWRGFWATATPYFSGDILQHPTNFNLYVVRDDYTSSATIAADVLASHLALYFDHVAIFGTSAIEFVIDGGGQPIFTGEQGHLVVPFACTISSWEMLADQSGSIVVDIWKDTLANFPPTVADTITGSAKPTLTSQRSASSSTLTGWTVALDTGDILAFNVDSSSLAVKRLTMVLNLSRAVT